MWNALTPKGWRPFGRGFGDEGLLTRYSLMGLRVALWGFFGEETFDEGVEVKLPVRHQYGLVGFVGTKRGWVCLSQKFTELG